MRIILKIIAASFVLALILAVAVLSFLSCIAGAFCWLACTAFVLLAACGFFAGLHTGCIAMLVLAFLVSPFGLPAIGEWLLERLYGVKYALQDFMFIYTLSLHDALPISLFVYLEEVSLRPQHA